MAVNANTDVANQVAPTNTTTTDNAQESMKESLELQMKMTTMSIEHNTQSAILQAAKSASDKSTQAAGR